MKEIHDWVPWFRELAGNIVKGGEAYLIERAKQVNWVKKNPALLEYGDEGIDPFSFFYSLASKNTAKQRARVYSSLRDIFEIRSQLPDENIGGCYIFPTPPPAVPVLFHNGRNFEPDSLWLLFRQALQDSPMIEREVFQNVLAIKNVGVTKLTQTLFLMNPGYFLPIDDITFHLSEALSLPELSIIKQKIKQDRGYEEYLRVLDKLKNAFSGCQPYEINTFLYLQKSGKLKVSDNFFQISTNVYNDGDDYWDNPEWKNFKENNYVYTGGPGEKRKYPLDAPKQGDIILVRTGLFIGKGIGIVYKNDYANDGVYKDSAKKEFNEEGAIHVLWINKSERELSGHTTRDGFIKTDPETKTYQAFKETEGYASTFQLLEHLSESNPPLDPDNQRSKVDMVKHPLNQILYGPPGTGKTWNTVNCALAIIEDESLDELEREGRQNVKRRFDELKEDGRIAMVTFHQNFAYEDFIEGIRPVLDDKSENLRYKLSQGVFKEIAAQAHDNSQEKYVLIIDEINRGNIAKIFGELITLLEESKRLGGGDETTVTLPYSKEEFGVPNNLYIIGTMNTADRSIALLDTALRRRFEFIEMMPDSSHDGIGADIEGVNCRELLAAMNKRIHFLLDREHQIGHTYFIDVHDLDSLAETFKNKIIPLLQEYFYDNWEKIDLVLNGNGFVKEESFESHLFKQSDLIDEERKIWGLSDDDERWKKPESYRVIYEKKQSEARETE